MSGATPWHFLTALDGENPSDRELLRLTRTYELEVVANMVSASRVSITATDLPRPVETNARRPSGRRSSRTPRRRGTRKRGARSRALPSLTRALPSHSSFNAPLRYLVVVTADTQY